MSTLSLSPTKIAHLAVTKFMNEGDPDDGHLFCKALNVGLAGRALHTVGGKLFLDRCEACT